MGSRRPIGGGSVRRPGCASVFQGFANTWEALPGSELSSARRGPRLPASSRRLGSQPHSGVCPFLVSLAGTTAGVRGRRPEKTSLEPRVGALGITSTEHFSTPPRPPWTTPRPNCRSLGETGGSKDPRPRPGPRLLPVSGGGVEILFRGVGLSKYAPDSFGHTETSWRLATKVKIPCRVLRAGSWLHKDR
ncbi:uncharacterized protein AAES06_015429 [Glossophaga mutica]